MKGFEKIQTGNWQKKGVGQIQPVCPSNEEVLDTLKILSHDLRGSLVSLSAILKLLTRGHYGKMEGSVESCLRDLQERVTHLIGMSEECLERSFSLDRGAETHEEVFDLREDIIHPVLKKSVSQLLTSLETSERVEKYGI